MSPRVRIALEALTAVGIGFLSSFIIRDPYADFAIAIFSFLALEILRIGLTIDKLVNSMEILSQVVESFQHPIQSSLDLMFNALLLSQLADRSFHVGSQRIRVSASKGPELWHRILSNIESSLLATNYALPEESWLRSRYSGESGLALQRGIIQKGAIIRRIFIVDSQEELEKIKNVLKAQRDIGIDVRYMERASIKQLTIASQNVEKLGTLDFAILDDRYLVRVFLDRGRKWKEVEFSRGSDILSLAKRVYKDLWEESSLIPD